jgi:hypothetical protein
MSDDSAAVLIQNRMPTSVDMRFSLLIFDVVLLDSCSPRQAWLFKATTAPRCPGSCTFRHNWSAKVRSLLFEQGENDVSLGQRCSIKFSARFRHNRDGLYIGQKSPARFMADENACHGEALAPKTRWRQPAPRLTCNTDIEASLPVPAFAARAALCAFTANPAGKLQVSPLHPNDGFDV